MSSTKVTLRLKYQLEVDRNSEKFCYIQLRKYTCVKYMHTFILGYNQRRTLNTVFLLLSWLHHQMNTFSLTVSTLSSTISFGCPTELIRLGQEPASFSTSLLSYFLPYQNLPLPVSQLLLPSLFLFTCPVSPSDPKGCSKRLRNKASPAYLHWNVL